MEPESSTGYVGDAVALRDDRLVDLVNTNRLFESHDGDLVFDRGDHVPFLVIRVPEFEGDLGTTRCE